MKNQTQTSYQLADLLVFHYSKYDHLAKQYTLNVRDIPEFDLHELAALMMSEDTELATSATGFDNPHYKKSMLPALIKHMSMATDATLRNDFDEAWLDGITSYLEKSMQNLIDDQCRERAFYQQSKQGYYPIQSRKTGEIEWRM